MGGTDEDLLIYVGFRYMHACDRGGHILNSIVWTGTKMYSPLVFADL